MLRLHPSTLSLALLGAGLAASGSAAAAEDIAALWRDGKPILDLRYRFEHVDQDNALDHANAQTLRTRVGFQSGQWYGLSALLEVDNVVLCAGQEPLCELYEPLLNAGVTVHKIGGADVATELRRATAEFRPVLERSEQA